MIILYNAIDLKYNYPFVFPISSLQSLTCALCNMRLSLLAAMRCVSLLHPTTASASTSAVTVKPRSGPPWWCPLSERHIEVSSRGIYEVFTCFKINCVLTGQMADIFRQFCSWTIQTTCLAVIKLTRSQVLVSINQLFFTRLTKSKGLLKTFKNQRETNWSLQS